MITLKSVCKLSTKTHLLSIQYRREKHCQEMFCVHTVTETQKQTINNWGLNYKWNNNKTMAGKRCVFLLKGKERGKEKRLSTSVQLISPG